MKPYYEWGGVVIYHGDCREALGAITLPPNTVVVTDPPYGVEGGRGGQVRRYGKALYKPSDWQDTPAYIATVVVPILTLLRERCTRMAVTPGNRCLFLYPQPDDIGCFWTPAGVGCGPWGFTTFNPVLYYGKDPAAGRGAQPSGISVTGAAEKNGHPCPKPLPAWKWLVAKVSLPGDTVLDPFMGSGTTLRAAKDLGRRAIGIEIEESYCQIAVERLSQTVMALSI